MARGFLGARGVGFRGVVAWRAARVPERASGVFFSFCVVSCPWRDGIEEALNGAVPVVSCDDGRRKVTGQR